MGGIKLVVTDIDGTLVEIGQHVPTPVVLETMQAVQAAGVIVAAATARPYEMARDLFAELGFIGPSIFDGGASIRDVQTGELLWQNWLELPRLKEVAAILLPHAETVDFFPVLNMVPAHEVTTDSLIEPAPYAWAMIHETALRIVQEQLIGLKGITVHPGVGKPDQPGLVDIQITDARSDKFHAVTELRKLVDANVTETLAIGDGNNDIPLFQNAGTKIAMGNAIPELQKLADHTIASVQEDGWAEAIQRFVLR